MPTNIWVHLVKYDVGDDDGGSVVLVFVTSLNGTKSACTLYNIYFVNEKLHRLLIWAERLDLIIGLNAKKKIYI